MNENNFDITFWLKVFKRNLSHYSATELSFSDCKAVTDEANRLLTAI